MEKSEEAEAVTSSGPEIEVPVSDLVGHVLSQPMKMEFEKPTAFTGTGCIWRAFTQSHRDVTSVWDFTFIIIIIIATMISILIVPTTSIDDRHPGYFCRRLASAELRKVRRRDGWKEPRHWDSPGVRP